MIKNLVEGFIAVCVMCGVLSWVYDWLEMDEWGGGRD